MLKLGNPSPQPPKQKASSPRAAKPSQSFRPRAETRFGMQAGVEGIDANEVGTIDIAGRLRGGTLAPRVPICVVSASSDLYANRLTFSEESVPAGSLL